MTHKHTTLRVLTKRALRGLLPTAYPPVLVASMGRSGSTLVFDAVTSALAAARFGPLSPLGLKITREVAWDMEGTVLQPGVVYKTHIHASEVPPECAARAVFLFGPASDAVISVYSCNQRYGPNWMAEHLQHMRATGSLSDLVERDALQLEKQVDGWFSQRRIPTIAMRYDGLWDNTSALEEFLGYEVTLPKRRDRQSAQAVDTELQAQIRTRYATLDQKIGALPDVHIFKGD